MGGGGGSGQSSSGRGGPLVTAGGAGAEGPRLRYGCGVQDRSGLCRPAVGEAWRWPYAAVARPLCGGAFSVEAQVDLGLLRGSGCPW